MIAQTVDLVEVVANYLGIIIIPIMTIILGRKVFRERKQIKKLNMIRFIIFCIFLTLSWLLIWEFLYESTPLGDFLNPELIISIDNTFSLYSFGLGFMITLALAMVTYTNRWESLYFISFFIFAGMFIVFLLTEIAIFLLPYVFAGGVISVVFLFATGFRLRDNSSLGIAIFATLVFPTLIAEKTIVGQILSLVYPIFGLIFALGYFKLFKEKGVEQNE